MGRSRLLLLASYLGIGLAVGAGEWGNPRNPLIRLIRDSDTVGRVVGNQNRFLLLIHIDRTKPRNDF